MSWPGSLKVAFGITFFAGFFQLAGFILPWWFVVGDGVYIGIWFLVGCRNGIANPSNCSVVAYSATDAIYNTADASTIAGSIFYTILQIVVTVALGFILLSFLMLMFAGCANSKTKCPYVTACILMVFSALFILAVVGFFAFIYTSLLIGLSGHSFDARTFPWSVLSSGLGGLLTFVAFIVLAVALCNWRMEDDDDDDLAMSNIPDKRGYDNPRYANDRGGYDGYAGGHQGYPRKEYPPYQPNSQPSYKNENMYRPYHQRY